MTESFLAHGDQVPRGGVGLRVQQTVHGYCHYPKGKKQFTITLPPELWEKLVTAKEKAVNEFVMNSLAGTMLQYKSYLRGLRVHCKELGISNLGTHGLRHTTSSLYLKYGASKDDMRGLFAHSSGAVTERYVHGQGSNLEKVASEMRLFNEQKSSQPQPPFSEPNKNRTKLTLIRCN